MLRIIAIEFILPKSTQCPETVKRQENDKIICFLLVGNNLITYICNNKKQ